MLDFLRPIEYVVAWIMVTAHDLLTSAGMDATSGWTWALSIVALVVVIRVVLIPLFVKQIKASRGMQLVAPEVRKIQQKYKGKTDPASRQKMTEETMAAYKKAGTNPFASCLPILLQMPIFFALFQVLNGLSAIASGAREPIGRMTQEVAAQAEASTLLGAPLSATFLGSDDGVTKLVTVLLIVLMSVTTFTTQRQLMTKNMPASMADNPMAQQQKMIMYILPLVFAVTGVNFPIGVLVYWLTTNVWSMAQQFYVIRNMPAPGSAAETKQLERKARKQGITVAELTGTAPTGPAAAAEAPRGQRVQPRRKDKNRRPGAAGAQPSTSPVQPPSGSTPAAGGAQGQTPGGGHAGDEPAAPPAGGPAGAGTDAVKGSSGGPARSPGNRRPSGGARGGKRGRQGSRPAARPSRDS
ncbi:membrane protein insertase YidC [uncultured Pseudokineococcus sp.]|uniref:membrane protein insertase YidC n=1 Tax=uncultured Pseudokineococcus sp. TaxID=1642928 RepID=UPI00262B6ECE|nr:membrane protein insertase YidC [uncultured Pseudokineococcus sp.]